VIDFPTLIVHVALLLVLPPLLLGVINRTKSWFAGRRGPPLLQPYYDLARLFRKEMVFSRTTTWVFRAGPVIGVCTAVLAGFLVPFGAFDAPVRFTGDLVLFVYLMALGRFFTTAAALDTGSAFEGMGAAREVSFACLAEAALFMAFVVLVRFSGALSLSPMFHAPMLAPLHGLPAAALFLVAVGLFVVLLAENSRIPVDDPNTHLELTMIHEVMVLDHSGPAFGLVLYGAAQKLYVFAAILVHLLLPAVDPVFRWITFGAGLLGVAVLIGIVESTMARLRMTHVPALLVAASLSCALGVILLLK
jgi:formate hydrogenlyase subunit 4